MPRYNVQDPQTGTSLVLEGDSPPTEQELTDIFAQQSHRNLARFANQPDTEVPPSIVAQNPLTIPRQETTLPQSPRLVDVGEARPPDYSQIREAHEALQEPGFGQFPRLPKTEDVPAGTLERALGRGIAAVVPGGRALHAMIGNDALAEANRSIVNQVISMPEFFTTGYGLMTMLGGVGKALGTVAEQVIGRGISGAFTFDLLKSALGESKELVKQWPTMTPAARARAVVGILGATGMGALTGMHTAAGVTGIGAEGRAERAAMLGQPTPGLVPPPEVKAWAQTFGAGTPPPETEMVRTSPEVFHPEQPQGGLGFFGTERPPSGPTQPYVPPEPGPLRPIPPTPKSIALQELVAKGWDTSWPFVPADLQNPSFIEGIRRDPTLSDAVKDRILSFAPGGQNEIKLSLADIPEPPPPAAPPERIEDYATRIEREREHLGTAPRPDVPPQPEEVRGGEGEQDRNRGGVQRVTPEQAQAPQPGVDVAPPKPPSLRPALLVNGKPVEGGDSHNAIAENAVKAAGDDFERRAAIIEAAAKDENHVFLDENNNILSRTKAGPKFDEIEGNPEGTTKSLDSQTLIRAREKKAAQPPLPPAAESGSVPGAIEAAPGTVGTVRTATGGEASLPRSTDEGKASEMTAEPGEIPGRSAASIRSDIQTATAALKEAQRRLKGLRKLVSPEARAKLEQEVSAQQERLSVLRGEMSRKQAARQPRERTKTVRQGVTQEDGLLFDIVTSRKIPMFLPDGLKVARYNLLRNKARAGEVLTTNERDQLARLRELWPKNFEDDYGPNGEAMRRAYEAAKRAGIDSELFTVVKDGRNLKLDTILDEHGFRNGVDLYNAVENLANQHADRVSGRAESAEVAAAKVQVEQQQAFKWDTLRKKATTEPLGVDELRVGTEFTLKGTKVRVTDVVTDEDGQVVEEVKLDDGQRYGTQRVSGKLLLQLRADKGSVKQPAEEGGWPEPESPPAAAPAPQQPAVAGVPEGQPKPVAEVKPQPPTVVVDLFGNPIEEPKPEVPQGPVETQDMLGIGAAPEPKAEGTPLRPLTEAEKRDWKRLTLKARAAREEGGEALTSEESRRYNELVDLMGQNKFEFASEEGTAKIKAEIRELLARQKSLEDAGISGNGRKAQERRNLYNSIDRRLRQLRSELTEGQGESLGETRPPVEMPSGYFGTREMRVRKLGWAEVEERFPTSAPAERMAMVKVYGGLDNLWVAESRRLEYHDAFGKELAEKAEWYIDGWGNSRDSAIEEAKVLKRKGWDQISAEKKSESPPPAPPPAPPEPPKAEVPPVEPQWKGGDRVMVGTPPMHREGTIAAPGPRGGFFVRTNLGEVFYEAKDIRPMPLEADTAFKEPTPSTPTTPVPGGEGPHLPLAQDGAEVNGWRKVDGRWRKIDEEDPSKVRGLPANKTHSANLEAQAALPPVPPETRSPEEMLGQVRNLKITLPREAFKVQVTYRYKGRLAEPRVYNAKDLETNPYFKTGTDIVKVEAGRIGKDGKFIPVEGIKITDADAGRQPPPSLSISGEAEKGKTYGTLVGFKEVSPDPTLDRAVDVLRERLSPKTKPAGDERIHASRVVRVQPDEALSVTIHPSSGTVGMGKVSWSQIEQVFGQKIVFVDLGDRPIAHFNGITFPDMPGMVFINARSTAPLLNIFGHEFLHKIRDQNRPLYDEMVQKIIPLLKNEKQFGADLAHTYALHGFEWPSSEKIRDELMSDFFGDSFGDPKFWNKLAEKDPNLFQRVATAVIDFLKSLITEIKALGGYQYITDIEKAHDVIADAVARFVKGEKGPGESGEPSYSLVKNPKDWRTEKAFDDAATALRTMSAWGDLTRMKDAAAQELNISPRARNMLALPNQMELTALAAADLPADLDTYMRIRDHVFGMSPHVTWNVASDAFEAMKREDTRVMRINDKFTAQAALIDSPVFQRKVARLDQAQIRAALTAEKEQTFRNIIGTKVAEYIREIETSRGNDQRIEQLRNDLNQARRILNFTQAVGQYMDQVVSTVFRNYFEWGAASRTGEGFLELFLAMRRTEGNPVTNAQELTLYRMASEVLANNRSLTEQLVWAERMRREPDFAQAVNDLGRSFAERIQRNPTEAIKEIVRREGVAATRAESARRAFLSLQKQVLPELERYSDLEQATSVNERVRNSPEWKQLVTTIDSDVGGFKIPEHILRQIPKEQILYGGGADAISRIDPYGNMHAWKLGFTPDSARIAQEGVKAYIGRINDWLFDPANDGHPDRAYWEREREIVDSIWNSLTVLDPSSVQSIGGFNPWGMPEFFFRQSNVPDIKVLQKYMENWHRSMLIGQQWSRGIEQPLMKAIRKAADAHNRDFKNRGLPDRFDYVNFGFQEWRERVLNPLAWEYRHDKPIQAGQRLYGVTILPEDIAAMKVMGEGISKLLKLPRNLGAERIMETAKLLDQFSADTWGIRRPGEFAAELGTTLPRGFSARARLLASQLNQIPVNRWDQIIALLDKDPNFEQFVVRWLGQRSADFAKITPFEDLFRQIVGRELRDEWPESQRNLAWVLQYIQENTDGTYSPEQIREIVVGGMESELRNFYKKFLEPSESTALVSVITPGREGPFTTGFQGDIGSSFYYDFGMISAPEVLSTSLESTMFYTAQLARQLEATERSLQTALLGLRGVMDRPLERRQMLVENRQMFRTGQEFRDYETLQQQLSFVKSLRQRLPQWSGKNAATFEGMQQLQRIMGSQINLALSGWKTLTRVLTAFVKSAHVMRAWNYSMMTAWPEAALSTIMSAVKIGLGGPSALVGRRLGLVKQFEGELSGWAEEIFRAGKFFNQQYDFGLGYKTPLLDTWWNNQLMPYTHGRGYDPHLSNVWWKRGLQKGFYRLQAHTVEAIAEPLRTVFPSLGYAIIYDSIARMTRWGSKRIESQLRNTFDYLEKNGRLGEFNLDEPNSLQNRLLPEFVLPPGIMPRNANNMNLLREFFNRGTDVDLQALAIHFWKRLSETPKEARGDVKFLAADRTGTPEELAVAERNRFGALASISLFDAHHSSPMNRPWAMRESAALRLMFPIAGWFLQSTRSIPALSGRAPYDRKLGAAMLTAMSAMAVLAWAGAALVNGEVERRIQHQLSWLLEKKVDPVRTIGQGRNWVENVQIAVSDITSYISILNSMFNMLLGESSNRGQMGAQVFVTEKLNAFLDYATGVAHTHDITYGLPKFLGNQVPNVKIITSRLPDTEGLQNQNNIKVAIQRYAPKELLRQQTGGVGLAVPTELSPIKQKLANAIYRGDSIGVQSAFDEFTLTAAKLGRPDPGKLAQEVFRSLNPYALALIGRPTEEQRAEILSKLNDQERNILLNGETQFLAAAQTLGIGSEMVRQERGAPGMGGGGGAAAYAGLPAPRGGLGGGSPGGRISLRGGLSGVGGVRLAGYGGRGLRIGGAGVKRFTRGRLRLRSGRVGRVGRVRTPRSRVSRVRKTRIRRVTV